MEAPGQMSQLTEMVPLEVFYSQLSNFVKSKATSWFMLNLSDLKPAVFSVRTLSLYLSISVSVSCLLTHGLPSYLTHPILSKHVTRGG